MAWPISQDYNEAVQNPRSSFADPELRAGTVAVNALGLPLPRSGNFADVYEFTCPGNTRWAVKCFTRQVAGLRERYAEVSRHLHEARLPFAVDFQYLEQGVRVRGQWYPLLKMRWVEGLLLNEFVRDSLDKPVLLQSLGLIWQRMARRLREAGVAHADLQHGNVLLVPGQTASSLAVKLIDYDGLFVPALAGRKSGEVGHPNYQHPQRLREGIYNAEVDRLPLLAVATSLRALAAGGRELWDRHDNGDNLLFRESDLRAPSESELFRELHGMADPVVRMLAGRLAEACERTLEDVPLLEELLPEEKQAKATRPAVAVAVAPTAGAATVAAPDWNFDDGPAPAVPRMRRKRDGKNVWGKVPVWGWVGGGVAALLLVGGLALATRKGDDSRAVAQARPETLAKDSGKPSDKQPPKDHDKPSDQGKKNNPRGSPGAPVRGGELRLFAGHAGPVHAVAVSPDGRHALSAGEDRTVRLWDVQTGKEIDKITDLEGPARSVAFSPDGNRFYATTGAKGLREWDTYTRTPIGLPRNGLYLSPHGLRGLTFGEVKQKPSGFVWTLGTGTSTGNFPLPEPPGAAVVAFAGQDSRIVIVTSKGTLYNCNLRERRGDWNPLFPGRPLCVACAPDQLLAVAGPAEGRLRAFDLPGRKVVRDFEARGQGPIHCLAFLPDSRRLVSGGNDGTVRAWDAGTGKQSAEFTGHAGPVAALTVLPDGLLALSAGRDGSLRLWDLTKLPPPATPEPSAPTRVANSVIVRHNWGYGIALSPDGRRLLSADQRGRVLVGDLTTNKPAFRRTRMNLHMSRSAFLPDGRQLVYVAPQDGVLKLLDVDTEKVVRPLGQTFPQVRFVTVSPDGKRALSGGGQGLVKDGKLVFSNCEVSLWDVQEGKRLAAWPGHAKTVLAARFTADGKRVVSCGEDGIRVWEVPGGKVLKHIPNVQVMCACVSEDGRFVAAGWGADPIRVWDVDTGVLKQLPVRKGTVQCLAFTRGGSRLLAGCSGYLPTPPGETIKGDPEQCVVRLYDVNSGQELRSFKGHQNAIMGLVATPDGRLAVSSSVDNTARVWDLAGMAALPPDPEPASPVPTTTASTRLTLPGGVNGVALSVDGRRLLVSDGTGTVSVWDVATRKKERAVPGMGGIFGRRLVFTADGGQMLCVLPDGFLKKVDLATGTVERLGPTLPFAAAVSVSADGRLALTAGGQATFKEGKRIGSNCALCLWDLKAGTQQAAFLGHTLPVLDARFSADGSRIVSCAGDGIRVWEIPDGKVLKTISIPNTFRAWVSADGRRAATVGPNNRVRLWDVETAMEMKPLDARKEIVQSVAFLSGGDRLLTGGFGFLPVPRGTPPKPDFEQCVMRLWDVKSGKELRCFKGHEGLIYSVAVTLDGRIGISGAMDNTVRLWDLSGAAAPPDVPVGTNPPADVAVRRPLHVLAKQKPILGARFLSNSQLLASSAQELGLWDAVSGRPGRTFLSGGLRLQPIPIPGSQRVLYVNLLGKHLRLFDLEKGSAVRQYNDNTAPIADFAVAPDGKQFLTGGGAGDKSAADDFHVRVWEMATGKLTHTLKGHVFPVKKVAFSADGRLVLSAGVDGVRVWDRKTGAALRHFAGVSFPSVHAFSEDGKQALTAIGGKEMTVWDTETGNALHQLTPVAKVVGGAVFVGKGERVLAWGIPGPEGAGPQGQSQALWVQDVKSGRVLLRLEGHPALIAGGAASPDGRHAATWGPDGTLCVWDLDDKAAPDKPVVKAGVREVRRFGGGGGPFHSVALSRDGRIMAAGPRVIWMWEADSGQMVASVGPGGGCRKAAFSLDGRASYITSERRGNAWDLSGRRFLATLAVEPAPLLGVAISPNGETMLTCGEENVFRAWNIQDNQVVRVFKGGHTGGVRTVAYSRNGTLVLSGGLEDGRVCVWDIKTAMRRKRLPGHKGEVLSVGLSRDGKKLLSAGRDGIVLVRDYQTGAVIRRITHAAVLGCAWNADGTQALVALPKGAVVLHDLKTGAELYRLDAGAKMGVAVGFAPDGRLLTGGDKDVCIWELPKAAPETPGSSRP